MRKSEERRYTHARNVRKVANRCVFLMIRGSGGSKSRLAKAAAGAEVAVQQRTEKLHDAVARSTFSSQNVQNAACSDHFSKFKCRKMVRRCGEKHICKSKCTKHLRGGQMSKNGTPLCREAHLQVKMLKT